MVNMQLLVFPALSVAWHITVVSPSGTMLGDVVLHETDPLMPELSDTVGVANVAVAKVDAPPVGATLNELGHVMLGFAPSRTLRSIEQLAVLLALSVAVHVTLVVVSTVNRVVPEAPHDRRWIPDPSLALTAD